MAGGVVLVLEVVGIAGGAAAVVLAQCAPDDLRGAWSRQAWQRRPVVAALMGWDQPAGDTVRGTPPAHARRAHPHRLIADDRERRLPPQPGTARASNDAAGGGTSGLTRLLRDEAEESVAHRGRQVVEVRVADADNA